MRGFFQFTEKFRRTSSANSRNFARKNGKKAPKRHQNVNTLQPLKERLPYLQPSIDEFLAVMDECNCNISEIRKRCLGRDNPAKTGFVEMVVGTATARGGGVERG